MFSLTYTSSYDPYHTVFRYLSLFAAAPDQQQIDFNSLRIGDFFHCFPWFLRDMNAYSKIPGFLKDKNNIVRVYSKPKFENVPDKRAVFERMLASQIAAKSALASSGVIKLEGELIVQSSLDRLSEKMQEKLAEYVNENRTLVEFLAMKLVAVPLLGPGGLKDRSGLGEFRYDIV